MIKKLRVTVDGKSYDVTVEVPDDPGAPPAPPPLTSVNPALPPTTPSAPPPPPSAPKANSGPGDVLSPLSGRVVSIEAQPGQEVKQGDRLLTVETMKMNTFISSPKDGKVGEILVAVGDTVEEGKVLARII